VRSHWGAAAAASLALLVALSGRTLTGRPASAATAPPSSTTGAPPAARIALLAQPAWTAPGGALPLRLRIDGDAARLDVRTVVHSEVTSRTGFERTVDGKDLGATVASFSTPAATLPVTGDGRALQLGLQAPNAPADPTRLAVEQTGVYPMEIELRDPARDERVDGFVTHLVVAEPGPGGAPAIGEPLEVAWIWRLVADPLLRASGKPDPAVAGALAPTGRLGVLAGALTQTGDLPITLAPGPETLESWTSSGKDDPTLAAGAAAVRAGAGSHQILAGPYVPVDIPSLEAGGLGSEVATELAQGADALGNTLGTRVDPRTALVDSADPGALERLRESGVDRVVLDPGALVTVRSKFTPARPFALESQGRRFAAAATDAALAKLLDRDAPPALRAQHFLAGLAVIADEQPNQRRGVVVAMPARWSPPLELLAPVLAGLRSHPLLAPVALDTLLATVPPEGSTEDPQVRELAGAAVSPLPVSERSYRAAEDQLGAFGRLVGTTDPRVSRGRRALLASLSSSWVGATGRREAEAQLAGIHGSVAAFLARVHVPSDRTLTLTARRAEIPVSLQNDTGRSVRVRVSLQSDKLLFPGGSSKILDLPPRNTTVRFLVDTRASGTFPLKVSVTSTDGHIVFQQTRYTVRSTVVSNVGLFLTIGAVLFLAGWWLNHTRRRRRARAPIAPAPAAGAPA
jgi:hypothetical protein